MNIPKRLRFEVFKLRAAVSWGVSTDTLKRECMGVRNWTQFSDLIGDLIKEAKGSAE